MPDMLAYLAGDENTMVVRSAKTNDVRLAVEFPNRKKMLVVCVMQTGDVVMSWCNVTPGETIDQMQLVGTIVGDELKTYKGQPTYDISPSPIEFTRLGPRGGGKNGRPKGRR